MSSQKTDTQRTISSRVQEEYRRLLKARRMVTRSRSETACRPCKARKSKCSDFRPCARCSAREPDACMNLSTDEMNARPSKRRQSDKALISREPTHQSFFIAAQSSAPTQPVASFTWTYDASSHKPQSAARLGAAQYLVSAMSDSFLEVHSLQNPLNFLQNPQAASPFRSCEDGVHELAKKQQGDPRASSGDAESSALETIQVSPNFRI
jgi:hypothetical protein